MKAIINVSGLSLIGWRCERCGMSLYPATGRQGHEKWHRQADRTIEEMRQTWKRNQAMQGAKARHPDDTQITGPPFNTVGRNSPAGGPGA